MPDGKMDLNQFIIALCESPHRWIKQATEGLTDEQLFYQPTPDTNSIAWLVWHLSRWRDKVSASIVGEPQVWTSQGWDQRFNMPGERTGLGDTLGRWPLSGSTGTHSWRMQTPPTMPWSTEFPGSPRSSLRSLLSTCRAPVVRPGGPWSASWETPQNTPAR
jgi:hypothetical protein